MKIPANSAYDMFSLCRYLSVNLVFFFSPKFYSGNVFLVAPFPDHCSPLPFSIRKPTLCQTPSSVRVAFSLMDYEKRTEIQTTNP